LTVDTNSITYKNCLTTPTVHWRCPGNRASCQVCGHPATQNFSGDECTQAPIKGGRTVVTGNPPPNGTPTDPKKGGGGGFGGPTCECVPGQQNVLTIKCCSSNCSMACSGAKSLTVKVCGGNGPYTISATGSVALKRANGVPWQE
jgi:hypothetical protein